MSLTWHIVKKDLRAFRWPLAAWVLLIVAKLGVGVMLFNADGSQGIEWFTKMDNLAQLLGALELVSFVLTAAVVQADPMVGTTAFWMTRPISGARLLRAKLLGLGLTFGLLPVVVTLPWWLRCGYGLNEIAWAAAETAGLQAAAVLAGLMWSAVTNGFGRFLLWTVVTVFAVPTLTGTIIYWSSRLQHTRGPAGNLLETRITLGVCLAVAGILTVVIHQYLTRQTRRSIAFLASAAGLIVLVGVAWPWNLDFDGRVNAWFARRTMGEWPAGTAPAGPRLVLYSAAVSGPGKRNGSVGSLGLWYRVEGLATPQVLLFYGGEFALRWPDGKVEPIHARARPDWAAYYANSRIHQATLQTLRPEYYAKVEAGPGGRVADTVTTSITLKPSVAERFKTDAPASTLTAWLRLMEFESVTPIPLRPGTTGPAGDRTERIVHSEKSGEELHVVFIRTLPSLLVDMAGGGFPSPEGPLVQYFLVNKERSLANRGRSVDFRLARIGTVGITWQTMAYQASSRAGGRRPLLEAIQALDDAQLVKVTYAERARYRQELHTDDLRAKLVDP